MHAGNLSCHNHSRSTRCMHIKPCLQTHGISMYVNVHVCIYVCVSGRAGNHSHTIGARKAPKLPHLHYAV